MINTVSHEDEPAQFEDAISEPDLKQLHRNFSLRKENRALCHLEESNLLSTGSSKGRLILKERVQGKVALHMLHAKRRQ